MKQKYILECNDTCNEDLRVYLKRRKQNSENQQSLYIVKHENRTEKHIVIAKDNEFGEK